VKRISGATFGHTKGTPFPLWYVPAIMGGAAASGPATRRSLVQIQPPLPIKMRGRMLTAGLSCLFYFGPLCILPRVPLWRVLRRFWAPSACFEGRGMAGYSGSDPVWLAKQDKGQNFSEDLCISPLSLGLGISSQAALNQLRLAQLCSVTYHRF